MSRFDSYAEKYSCICMERRDGILQVMLHTDGGSLRWSLGPHGELPDAFGADGEAAGAVWRMMSGHGSLLDRQTAGPPSGENPVGV